MVLRILDSCVLLFAICFLKSSQSFQFHTLTHAHRHYTKSFAAQHEIYPSKEIHVDLAAALEVDYHPGKQDHIQNHIDNNLNVQSYLLYLMPLMAIISVLTFNIHGAVAVGDLNIFDPSQFQPVCPASDGVYQVLKLTANNLVGQENVVEYGPLIASVLLRVRLELCVLESFVYEAVVPFVQQKGLSWVLPLHETVESFLAGTIFAIASNFILLGSTKILSTLFIYFDALTGFPARLIGGISKRAFPDSVVGKGAKLYGDLSGGIRQFLESTDTFVGRYLVVVTSAYIAFKFAHFKFFNDIFP